MLDLGLNDRQHLPNDRLSRRSLNETRASEDDRSCSPQVVAEHLVPIRQRGGGVYTDGSDSNEDLNRTWADFPHNNQVPDIRQMSANASQCGSDGHTQLSGVEWSVRGRYPPIPSTSMERTNEANKLGAILRELMNQGRVGTEEDATVRVKLQSLVMALQNDAKQAAQQALTRRCESLEDIVEDLHELLDAHEAMAKAATRVKGQTSAPVTTPAASLRSSRQTQARSAMLNDQRFSARRQASENRRRSPGIRLWATSSTTPCDGRPEEADDDWAPAEDQGSRCNGPPDCTGRRRRFQSNANYSQCQDDELGSSTALDNENTHWAYQVNLEKNFDDRFGEVQWMRKRISELEATVEMQRDQLQNMGESAKYRGRATQDQRRIRELTNQVFALQAELERQKHLIHRLRRFQQADCSSAQNCAGRHSRQRSRGVFVIYEEDDFLEIRTQLECLEDCVKIKFCLLNLSHRHPLDCLNVSFRSSRYLHVEITEDWPKYILPRHEVFKTVTFVCETFFVSSPIMEVDVEIARVARSVKVTLPITIISFCRPAAITLAESNELANNPMYIRNEHSRTVAVDCGVTLSMLRDALIVSEAFRLVSSLRSPHSALEGAKFILATQPLIQNRLVAIATVQLRGSKCSVSVRSGNATLSEGIVYGIKSLLSTLSERIFPF